MGTPPARRRARAPLVAATPRRPAATTPVAVAAAAAALLAPADWAAGKGLSHRAVAVAVVSGRGLGGVCGRRVGRACRHVVGHISFVLFAAQACSRGSSLRFAPSLLCAETDLSLSSTFVCPSNT